MLYDKNKKNELIISYLPLVKQVVYKIDGNNSGYEFDDLVNIGVIGLIDAINKFDESKKVPFNAYARIRINGSILDELRKAGPVSRNRIEKLKTYYNMKSELENKLMRTPTQKEIQDSMKIEDSELSTIYETLHYLSSISLEAVILTKDGMVTELIDVIEDKNTAKPEELFLKKEMEIALSNAIESLNARLKTVLNLYYVEELNMKEIAYIMDVSIPRVSQLHGKALDELRDIILSKMDT